MGKRIENISNYPLSEGAVPYSNRLLLQDGFAIRTHSLKDYLNLVSELSKDVLFFGESSPTHTWNDLLKKDAVFQLSAFLTLSVKELHGFFKNLPQINGYLSDTSLSETEYATLAWQRFSVLQYLFGYYKTVCESTGGEDHPQVLSILKSDAVSQLFIRYRALLQECLAGPPVLINALEKTGVPPFNGMRFPPVDDSLNVSLNTWYNPDNLPVEPLLGIYSTTEDKIKAANEYLYTFFRGLMQVQQMFNYQAANRLQELSTNTRSHEPHTGLLMAFCKLIMLYDAQYNQLIQKHTAFVFSDILRLQKQAPLPDTAYVSLGLAPNVKHYFLQKNTLFKAGKNSAGKPLYYRSTADIVLNSARITALRSSVRIRKANELQTVAGTEDAAGAVWQVNNAWLPFNDIGDTYTGTGFESRLLEGMQKKDTVIRFEFQFDNNVPEVAGLPANTRVILLLADGTEAALAITSATANAHTLTISTKIEKDLPAPVKTGVNARVTVASPGKDDTGDYPALYRFLLKRPMVKIKVKIDAQEFTPARVHTAFGSVDGSTSFVAFGSRSLAGASFRVHHPFISYADRLDITLHWDGKLQEVVKLDINGYDEDAPRLEESTVIRGFENNRGSSLQVKLRENLLYYAFSTFKRGSVETTVTTALPRVLLVKSIDLKGDLEELVYEKDTTRPVRYTEERFQRYFAPLQLPYAGKAMQKTLLRERYKVARIRFWDSYRNNLTVHLYPFGERRVNSPGGLTFLPDYSAPNLGFNDYEADLYIGLSDITPGQSISLLFDIAAETAGQSEQEARISWHFVTDEKIEALDPSRVIDTTRHFLQTGIVHLTLPPTATAHNRILYGDNTCWLVARCHRYPEQVAHIRSIKTNGVAVERVLDDDNREARPSVAPGTIENLFPKTANVKSVTQDTPSFNGRETETDRHYFWRSSMRLRHKRRGIAQWDMEQLILEQFPGIYKVKCLNHAVYDEATVSLTAQPGHCLITLVPYYLVNPENPNLQPAVPLSVLMEVKAWLESRSSPFLRFQVLNTRWDIISVDLEITVNPDIRDLLSYRDRLNRDIMRFFSPWAFDAGDAPAAARKIYAATLVDFIDELPYVHYIRKLKLLKNGLEVNDEIASSSAIHFLTSATGHTLTVHAYDS